MRLNALTGYIFDWAWNLFILTISLFCWVKALTSHSDHCRGMGYKTGGGGDRDSGRNGRHPGETETLDRKWPTSAWGNWDASLQPAAAANARVWLEVRLLSSGRRPPGPDDSGHRGMGDDVRRRQIDDRLNYQYIHECLHTRINAFAKWYSDCTRARKLPSTYTLTICV